MFAFVMLILYGILVGVIAICFLCVCCFFCAYLCCDIDDENPTEGQITVTGPAGAFKQFLYNKSETAKAYNRNLQSDLQSLLSFRQNAGAHTLSTPNTDNTQSVSETNNDSSTIPHILPTPPSNCDPNIVNDMQPLDPAPPVPNLTTPENLPPSYGEAIEQE